MFDIIITDKTKVFNDFTKGTAMCYRVVQCQVAPGNCIYDYCGSNAKMAKLLYNAALFRIRQIFTGYDKQARTANEKEVFAEVELLQKTYPSIQVKRFISYTHLEKLMRVTENPDFFAGLPMQTAQAVIKQARLDFDNWLKALKAYKKDPSGFLGKPRMPHYRKQDVATFTISSQDAVLYFTDRGTLLKLPLISERLYLPNVGKSSILKEVKIKPFYGRYILSLTIEEADPDTCDADMPNLCAIDFGTDNFAAVVCSDGSSRLYKGGAVLSECQWFHKEKARATGIITKGHERMHADSRYLRKLSLHHENFTKDQCHKISRSIIGFCLEHKAGTLVLGENRFWKQHSGIGRQNNQKFVSMPVARLRQMLVYKAEAAGIRVVVQEESYTSKADITAMDYIPVYGMDDIKADFSGSRISRGLYRCADGLVINADCNGAANILRKAFPDAWEGQSDWSFLASPEVYGFHELNPQSNPVKWIGAA